MRPQQTIYECIIKINQAIINDRFWLGIDTLEDIKHHLNEAEKLVNVDQRVMPVACGHCKECKYLHTEEATNGEDLELCNNSNFRLWNLTNCEIDTSKFGCTYFESKPSA